jgi:hypothetical protein
MENANDEMRRRMDNALFDAGQLIGGTMRLDIEALEQYLENPPRDFHYTRFCKAVLTFARTVNDYQ